MFRSKNALLSYLLIEVFCLIHQLINVLQMIAFVEFHELVASWALGILEADCVGIGVCWLSLWECSKSETIHIICKPLLLNFSLNTIEVEDMFATKLDDSFFSKALNVTYRTIRVSVIT